MFLNFDENRPDTPRVPRTFTRLEQVLLAVVAYQALMLVYFFAPTSWLVQPVKQLIADEPIRYVTIEPLVDRSARPRTVQPPPDLGSRSARPTPVPQPDQSMAKTDASDNKSSTPTDVPKVADKPQPTLGPNDAPPAPKRIPGGILGSAMRNLQELVQSQGNDVPEGGMGEGREPDIQFDPKGIDFGPWLRRFRAQVYRNWLIPQAAQVLAGHVVIQMSILRTGAIVNPHIVRASGVDSFDSAALTALKLSNPTMRLPDGYPLDSIDPFTVTFYYNERIR
jgi:outer membrane biosynthesis protein TonB